MANSKPAFILSLLIVLFANLISPPPSFSQTQTETEETLTITTYYPSPYGVYNEMRAKKMAVGTGYYDASAYPWDSGVQWENQDLYGWWGGNSCYGNEICWNADLAVQNNLTIGKYLLEERPLAGSLGFKLRIRPQYGQASLVLDAKYNTDLSTIGFSRYGLGDTYQIRVSHNHPTAWAGGNAFGITAGDPAGYFLPFLVITPDQLNTFYMGIGTIAPKAFLHINPTLITGGNGDRKMFQIGMVYNNPGGGADSITNWYGGYIATPTGTGPITNKYALVTEAGAGNVGIGTISPTQKLEVAGSGLCTGGAGCWQTSSDVSLKKNVRLLDYGLKEVMRMKPVRFEWRNDSKSDIGLIAQEMEAIIPEMVAGEEGKKSIGYSALVPVLVQAIKEQEAEITELRTRLAGMEAKIGKED